MIKIQQKTATFWLKKTSIKALIALIFVFAGIVVFIPHGTRADYLVDGINSLTDVSTAQENTVVSASNPITAANVARRIQMTVTAYSSTVGQTDSTPFVTASNTMVRDGIVANNLLPFGTKIKIPSLYGNKVFIVEDRMNRRMGSYRLDIWFPEYSQAKSFGVTTTEIEVLTD